MQAFSVAFAFRAPDSQLMAVKASSCPHLGILPASVRYPVPELLPRSGMCRSLGLLVADFVLAGCAAVTKYHSLVDYKEQRFISHSSGGLED